MKKLSIHRLSIVKKFLLLSLVSLSALIIIGIYGLINSNSSFDWVAEVYETASIIEKVNREIERPIHELRQISLSMVMAPNQELRRQLHQEALTLMAELDQTLKRWQTDHVEDHPHEKHIFNDLITAWEQYKTLLKKTSNNVLADYREAAFINANGAEKQQFSVLAKQLDQWVDIHVDLAENVYYQATLNHTYTQWVAIIAFILFTLFVSWVSWYIAQSITHSVRKAVQIAETVSTGDLTVDLSQYQQDTNSDDETWQMLHALAQMVDNLRQIVMQLQQTGQFVTSTTEQLTTVSTNITNGAKQQVSVTETTFTQMSQMVNSIESVTDNTESLSFNVDETMRFMEFMNLSIQSVADNVQNLTQAVNATFTNTEQMVTSIEHINHNTNEASQYSQTAVDKAKEGSQVVEKTVGEMYQISNTMQNIVSMMEKLDNNNKKINGIVDIISEISEQTNLLALNAAIEAARAGEHGKGFAVVAQEVRKLAERSASLSKEIVKLIGDVQKDTESAIQVTQQGAEKSEQGVTLATQAVDSLKEIMQTISNVNNMVLDIDNITKQQTKASQQVVNTVNNMWRITQEVDSTTKEQLENSQQVRQAMETMNYKTKDVSTAMQEQKQSSEQVIAAIENISAISQKNLVTATEITAVVENLTTQAKDLQRRIDFFNYQNLDA